MEGAQHYTKNTAGGASYGSYRSSMRPRSPSHAAKNKTPEHRVGEFGCVLAERAGRLICKACNLNLDHTRRSTIVEHLRSRKHQRFLDGSGLENISMPQENTFAPIVFLETLDEELSNSNLQSIGVEQSTSRGGIMPGMSGCYLLKKETHCTTILDQLLHDDTFTDVTLTAQGQSIRAHRIVLSLASGYFREVLCKESNIKNVIVFKDLKFLELRNIINFIYTGEATVDASELESFMSTAEMLEITSLCEGHKNLPKHFISGDKEENNQSKSTSKRSAGASSSPPSKSRKVSASNATTDSHISVKSEPDLSFETMSDTDLNEDMNFPKEDEDDFDGASSQNVDGKGLPPDRNCPDDPSPGTCPYCPDVVAPQDILNHLQTHHPSQQPFTCNCGRVFTAVNKYKKHQNVCLTDV